MQEYSQQVYEQATIYDMRIAIIIITFRNNYQLFESSYIMVQLYNYAVQPRLSSREHAYRLFLSHVAI